MDHLFYARAFSTIARMSTNSKNYRLWTDNEVKLLVDMRDIYPDMPWPEFEDIFNEAVPSDRKRSAVALASKHLQRNRYKHLNRHKKKILLRSEPNSSARRASRQTDTESSTREATQSLLPKW